MNWITENITAFVSDVIGGTVDMFGNIINNIFFWIVEVAVQNVYMINAERFVVASAIALIGVVVVKIVLSGYMLETDYDSDEDPFNLLVRIAETVAFMSNGNWLFNYMLSLAKKYTSDLAGGTSVAGYSETTESLLNVAPGFVGNRSVAYIMMLLAILIAVIIFTVVAGLRGAELVAMMLFYPYFCLDKLTNSRERWNNFFMAYMSAFFTYAFQILFFMIAMKCYATAISGFPLYSIATLVFIILAIKAPKFLEKFLYRSGVSNAASSGIRMVLQTAMLRR